MSSRPLIESQRPIRILVVEDEQHIAKFLQFVLTTGGYDVTLAYDGEDALAVFEQYHPDGVLLDLVLPGISGLDVLRQLRSNPSNSRLAILILTVPGLVLFYAPIVIGVSRVVPRLALLMVALGFATAAWSVQLSLWLGVQFAQRLGRERGSKMLQTAALSLGAAAVLGFASLLRASKGPEPIAIYLAATLSVLPLWMRATARAFASVMTIAEPPSYACAPRWGRPSWWSLLRTRPIFVGLPAALSIAGLHFAGAPIRSGASASILVLVALAPLGRLFTAEYERPERWRLAPLARRMRWSALTWVGLPCALASTIAAVIIGWGNLGWQVALTVLSCLGPLSCLILSSLPRHLVQAALVMGALATGALL